MDIDQTQSDINLVINVLYRHSPNDAVTDSLMTNNGNVQESEFGTWYDFTEKCPRYFHNTIEYAFDPHYLSKYCIATCCSVDYSN